MGILSGELRQRRLGVLLGVWLWVLISELRRRMGLRRRR